MNRKYKQSIYHPNVNVDLMGKYVIHINGGITVNVDGSVKNVMRVRKLCLVSSYMQLQKWKKI